jgi:hypothetical protein
MYGEFNCDELFAPYSGQLEKLARKHNLKISKYKYDMPQWDFFFLHPKGGVGRVEIQIPQTNRVAMLKWWWIDDYSEFTRKTKATGPHLIEASIKSMEEELLKAIKEILAWRQDDLGGYTCIARGEYSDPGSLYSKVKL